MYRIIFQMLFWLGCRVGELLALTSENLSDYGQGNRDAIQKGSWMVMRMVRGFYNEQNNMVIGTVKPMSYAELDVERITLQEQAQIGELYMLAKKELYLLDQIMGQKELYYKEAINKIQKEMRKK